MPGGASESAAIVSVEVPPALTVAGLSVAVSPAGEVALRLIESAVPVTTVVLMVLVSALP